MDKEEMESLLKEAEDKKLWLVCSYQGLYFSPQELRDYQAAGRFRWGACNWWLADPYKKIESLDDGIRSIEQEKAAFQSRIDKWKVEQ